MTNIKLTVTGAQARASVTGPLTSGMVGIPVVIEYDEAWDALTKNLICRCSPWGSIDGENRAILNVGETASVAHEVMLPDRYLYLGLEGFREDGTLVMPTTWACCGKIVHGANTCEDPSTAPSLSVWNQLQVEMEQLQEQALTQEQAAELQACAQEARQAAEEAKQAAASAGGGLYYTPIVTQPTDNTLEFLFRPSVSGAPIPNPVVVELPSGGSDSEENVNGGVSTSARNLLITILRNGQYISDQSDNITALEAALASGGGDSGGDTGGDDSGGGSVGNEIILSDLEWVNGKTLYGSGWYDNAQKSVSTAVDVGGAASLKIVVAEPQSLASAPAVASVPDTENVTGYKYIANNEAVDWVGGAYAYEITFDVSEATYIRFIVETALIDKLTVTVESEVG